MKNKCGESHRAWPVVLLFLMSGCTLFAQSITPSTARVTEYGKELSNPWAGGLNAPQLSMADFNRDGIPDLYIFDREGNVHLTFIARREQGQVKYRYEPAYAAKMPAVESWVLLRDYNGDGIMDIFAYSDLIGIDGMCVYTGYYEGDTLAFRRFNHQGPFNLASFPLRGSIITPIYITRADYPAVDDVDCDGDLDLLTFNLAGGYCEFYRNQSVERGFGTDSLIFVLDDNCWGGFYESGLTERIDLAPAPGGCFRPSITDDLALSFRHAGSTLLTLDMDGDGDLEIILGDVSFNNLTLLTNGGNCSKAWMNAQDNLFPSNDIPVNISVFPASFHVDLDQDGRKDLAVAPNARFGSENREVIWYYRNEGSAAQPRFVLQQRDFMVGEMIDVGIGANPAFADVNGDGLMDLVVGNQNIFSLENDKDTRMILYLNAGTPTEPHFVLADEDWLRFSRFSQFSFGFTPAFGDLDQDGDLDLIVGEESGRLFYLENLAGPGQPMRFGEPVFPYLNIDIGLASTPYLADVDGDGLADLLVGERTGNVNFFLNQGTRGNPSFNPNFAQAPNIQFFAGIDTRQFGYISGYSAPVIVSHTDSLLILTGTEELGMQLYSAPKGNLQGAFSARDLSPARSVQGFNLRPALADINADGFLEMVVGNSRGGLQLYKTSFRVATATSVRELSGASRALDVFPNPASSHFQVLIPLGIQAINRTLQLLDAQGRLVRVWENPDNAFGFSLEGLPRGWYAVRLIAGKEVLVARLLAH